jgi:secondary thiamine-phosphate synthase enzyme|tara:strand:+ start:47 stop:496 length:450 start_codon:yes stop_codon:yes gene_type:complete
MKKCIEIKTDKLFTNITEQVRSYAKEWNKSGIVNIFSTHSTMCIWLTEDEILHHADVRFFLDSMAPITKSPEGQHKNTKYLHDMVSLRREAPQDERINGHSHIRSMFFNSSETVPVEDGDLILGNWKSIFAIELDPARERKLVCTFISE